MQFLWFLLGKKTYCVCISAKCQWSYISVARGLYLQFLLLNVNLFAKVSCFPMSKGSHQWGILIFPGVLLLRVLALSSKLLFAISCPVFGRVGRVGAHVFDWAFCLCYLMRTSCFLAGTRVVGKYSLLLLQLVGDVQGCLCLPDYCSRGKDFFQRQQGFIVIGCSWVWHVNLRIFCPQHDVSKISCPRRPTVPFRGIHRGSGRCLPTWWGYVGGFAATEPGFTSSREHGAMLCYSILFILGSL